MFYNCYNYPNTKLKTGDLVFFKPAKFFENNFISGIVASSPTGVAFYHVAMVAKTEIAKVKLLEANPKQGVAIAEYNNLCKAHGLFNDIEVLRVNLPAENIAKSVKNAINLVGSEYNDIFSANFVNSKGNQAFYCSQIIQYAFNNATQSNIFSDISMSFKDGKSEVSEYWKDYFTARSVAVPQGEPGTHPASIYESEFLMCF